MSHFQKALKMVLEREPFRGIQRALALHAGIDPAQLSRVVAGEREPTPELVGRLCGSLPADVSACLFKAFLEDIVAATAEAKPGPLAKPEHKKRRGTWKPPLSDVAVQLQCAPRRKYS